MNTHLKTISNHARLTLAAQLDNLESLQAGLFANIDEEDAEMLIATELLSVYRECSRGSKRLKLFKSRQAQAFESP